MLDSFLFMCVGDLSHTFIFFFFNDTATTEIYTLSLHDALPISLACFPTQIAGRNRMWRKMIIDDIKTDPDWKTGESPPQPRGLRAALQLLSTAGSAPLVQQRLGPTRDSADAYITRWLDTRFAETDANDLMYQVDASRDYDPSTALDRITAPVLTINSADDFINPPELGGGDAIECGARVV